MILMRFFTFLALLLIVTSNLRADELRYDLRAYGERLIILNVEGAGAGTLSLTPSGDQRTITLSGLKVKFIPLRKSAYPSIIKAVRNLDRGNESDLIVELTTPAKVNAVPAPNSLQVMMRIDKSFFKAASTSIQKEEAKILDLPMLSSPKGATRIGNALRLAGFSTDIIAAILNGLPVKFDSGTSQQSTNSCIEEKKQISHLESLIDKLSAEVLSETDHAKGDFEER